METEPPEFPSTDVDPITEGLNRMRTRAAVRLGLRIRLKDPQGAGDAIPSFSPEVSPVAQEAALLSTMATISREHIQYVGIVASDVLDSIFLGHLLKQHCPDVRPFIFDSDLVYAHIAQNSAFQGMLMVTSYPLVEANQRWTNSWNGLRRRRQFSSATAEGVYNAGLVLLEPDSSDPPLLEYGLPGARAEQAKARPPLWLTVVGRGGIWPLTPLPASGDSGQRPATAWGVPRGSPERPLVDSGSRGWAIGFWMLTLFCGLFAGAVVFANSAGQNRDSVLGCLWVGSDGFSGAVRGYLSAAVGFLLIAYGFLVAVEISRIGVDNRMVWGGALFVPVLAALTAGVFYPWLPGWRAVVLGAVFAALFSVRLYLHPAAFYYVFRVVHVGNGVPPAVPSVLLALALFWWMGAHLNRIRLCRAQPEGFPDFASDCYLGGAPALQSRLMNTLRSAWLGWWSWLSVALLVVSVLVVDPRRVASIETFPFEWPYIAGLCLLYAGLLFSCARFLGAWFQLRGILHLLELHSLRDAFQRIPKNLSNHSFWNWGGRRQSLLTLGHSIERLRLLAARREGAFDAPWGCDYYQAYLETVEENTQAWMAADAAGRRPEEKVVSRVHESLLRFSNNLVEHVLLSAWSNVGRAGERTIAAAAGSSTLAVSGPHRPSSATCILAEEFVALRFVALIQYVMQHLRNLLEFVAGGLILAVISLNAYPFEPQHSITTIISICFASLSAIFVMAFVQMSRNTILSYLSDTKPGKLDGNLIHALSFGALPLVTVLSSQFPSIGGFLFSWVKPTLESLR